jgi:hypothetical protein
MPQPEPPIPRTLQIEKPPSISKKSAKNAAFSPKPQKVNAPLKSTSPALKNYFYSISIKQLSTTHKKMDSLHDPISNTFSKPSIHFIKSISSQHLPSSISNKCSKKYNKMVVILSTSLGFLLGKIALLCQLVSQK